MFLFYGGLCVNFDIIGESSHGSNLKHVVLNSVVHPYLSSCDSCDSYSFYSYLYLIYSYISLLIDLLLGKIPWNQGSVLCIYDTCIVVYISEIQYFVDFLFFYSWIYKTLVHYCNDSWFTGISMRFFLRRLSIFKHFLFLFCLDLCSIIQGM